MHASTAPIAPPFVGAPVPAHWARVRFALLAGLAFIAVAAVVLGTRSASYFDLTKAISDGRVRDVIIAHELGPGWSGSSNVLIQWSDGNRQRYTEVRQERHEPGAPGQMWTSEIPGLVTIQGSVSDDLRQYTAEPLIITPAPDQASAWSDFLGWRAPVWVGFASLFLVLGALAVLVAGPQPRWATRWAWFWGMVSPLAPIVIPAFLLIGVPKTGEIERLYTKAGRLTGGWAFILFCIVLAPLGALLT